MMTNGTIAAMTRPMAPIAKPARRCIADDERDGRRDDREADEDLCEPEDPRPGARRAQGEDQRTADEDHPDETTEGADTAGRQREDRQDRQDAG